MSCDAEKQAPRRRRTTLRAPASPACCLEKRACLPAIMGERLVGVGHAVRVVLLLDRRALVPAGGEQLGRETVLHGLLAAGAGVAHQPAHGEGLATLRADLDRHLVGGAADAARLHLEDRLGVVERRLEDGLRRLAAALLPDAHGAGAAPLCDGLPAGA